MTDLPHATLLDHTIQKWIVQQTRGTLPATGSQRLSKSGGDAARGSDRAGGRCGELAEFFPAAPPGQAGEGARGEGSPRDFSGQTGISSRSGRHRSRQSLICFWPATGHTRAGSANHGRRGAATDTWPPRRSRTRRDFRDASYCPTLPEPGLLEHGVGVRGLHELLQERPHARASCRRLAVVLFQLLPVPFDGRSH